MKRAVWEGRGVKRSGARMAVAVGVAAAFVAFACGGLDSPTEPAPDTRPQSPGNPAPNPNGPPVLGAPASPTPSPAPGGPSPSPSPSPTADPGAADCGDPVPPDVSHINVNIHIRGPEAWTLDSTPLVGPNADYCRQIGFTDGRSMCPVRPEGNPQRQACELLVTGRAKDTGRAGPTWYRNGSFCTSAATGCMNHPDNQYLLLTYASGTYQACAKNGVCGEVEVER